MLDIKAIRENKDHIQELLRRKEPDVDLSSIVALDEEIRQIKTKVEQLKSSPEIGRIVVPEIRNDQFRELIYGNYRVVYRIEKEQISILTIRHGKQILPINEILA